MNFDSRYENLLNDIFNGEKDIAVFISNKKHYYVFDNKENYCIDVRPEYESYIKKGWMDASRYDEAIRSFREGIPVLRKDNFQDYLNKNKIQSYSAEWMKSFFISGRTKEQITLFYEYIENFLSYLNEPVSDEWDSWRMRLPKFYINFDKKVYRHTNWDIAYESSAPSDWNAQANSNFGLLVPDNEQYWIIDGMNFWKLQM